MCKPLPLLVAVFLTLMISACSPQKFMTANETEIYRRLHQKYSRMESYSATVEVTVYGNKTENRYTMTQQVKNPDLALITVTEPASLAGSKTLIRGEEVFLSAFPGEEPANFPAKNETEGLLLNDFFSLYYRSEETALEVSTQAESGGNILLETVCIPKEAHRYRISLLCDSKSLEPKTLTVYDMGGNIRKKAEFSNFSYNPSFDSSIFVIQ